ncbi:UDP-N-acetyl-D-mannosamine dehydrogenase [Aliihoeflea sp. PC F10.4]
MLIASRGLKVIGVDINETVTSSIMAGSMSIREPGLEPSLREVVAAGNLTAQQHPSPADVFVIAVPTPFGEHFEPCIDYVLAAARSLAPVLQRGNLVVVESTCPVGTTEQVCALIRRERPDLRVPGSNEPYPDISVAYCPERVLPGRILIELVTNDRCIGGITEQCALKAQRFYETFVRGECTTTTARTAEMVKLAENAFRDTNIAFANELSMLADHLGVDVWSVIRLANKHPRVNILSPGPGVGGHCIAVDPWFLVHSAPDIANLIRTSRQVNDEKLRHTLDRACRLLDTHPNESAACFGLTFKANVDDIRESPALTIATELARRYGDRIRIVEPNLDRLPPALANTGARLTPLSDALASCTLGVLLVDHDEFRSVPIGLRKQMRVLDTRGLWRDAQPTPQAVPTTHVAGNTLPLIEVQHQ